MPPALPDDRAAVEAAALKLVEELQKRIASNLRKVRAQRAWTQDEAAWKTAMGTRMYQGLEGGSDSNATLRTLARLCVGYGIDMSDLFTVAPPSTRPRAGRPKKGTGASTKKAVSKKTRTPPR